MAERQASEGLEALQQKITQVMADAQDTVKRELEHFNASQDKSASSGLDSAALLTLVIQFNEASTQVGLLNLLVEAVAEFVPRTMLLIRKGSAVHGWAGKGFSAEFITQQLKRVKWPIKSYREISQVIQNGKPLLVSFSDLSSLSDQISAFDGFVPLKSSFYPVQVKNKIAAILYCDTGSEPRLENQDLVEVLTRIAGTELTLVTSKLKKTGLTKAGATAPKSKEKPSPVAPKPKVVAEPEPQLNPAPVETLAKINDLPSEPSTFGTSPPQIDFSKDGFESSQGLPSLKTQAIETQAIETQPTPEVSQSEVEEDPSIKKARRVARVLVSDLKLYNETTVETGRRNKDLYKRLREDIDRSFKHYQERVSTLLTDQSTNYFKEELIKQLADGDQTKLGPLPF